MIIGRFRNALFRLDEKSRHVDQKWSELFSPVVRDQTAWLGRKVLRFSESPGCFPIRLTIYFCCELPFLAVALRCSHGLFGRGSLEGCSPNPRHIEQIVSAAAILRGSRAGSASKTRVNALSLLARSHLRMTAAYSVRIQPNRKTLQVAQPQSHACESQSHACESM